MTARPDFINGPGTSGAFGAQTRSANDPVRRELLRGAAVWAAMMAVGSRALAKPEGSGDAEAPDPTAPFRWPALPVIGGASIDPATLRGSAVVLVVWATWCPFCARHNPHVEALHRSVAGRPLRVIGAPVDRDPALVLQYQRERGITFPNVTGAEQLRALLKLERVLPMTVTFDRRGRLLQRVPGEMFEEDVLELGRLADDAV